MQDLLHDVEETYAIGEFVQAIEKAQQALRDHKDEMSEEHYVSLYRIVGLCARRLEKMDVAERALSEAYRRAPLNREIVTAYADLMFETQRPRDGAALLESLMVRHSADLPPRVKVGILRTLASHYIDHRKPKRAWSKLEMALALFPDEPDLGLLLLRVLKALDERDELISQRAKLIEKVTDAMLRSRLLRDQATAMRATGRPEEALELTQQAYLLDPRDEVFEDLAAELERNQLYEKLVEVLTKRSERLEGDAFVDAIQRLVDICDNKLGDTAAAAAGLELLLDREPTDLQPFERLTQIHASKADWHGLHDAYARMIQRTVATQPDNTPLLGVLWRNLGELCRTQLQDEPAALYAFQMAAQFSDDPEIQDIVIALSAKVGSADEQVESLANALKRSPDRVDIAERYGAALMKAGKTDHGFLVLRTVVARGGGSEKAREMVTRLKGAAPKLEKTLTNALRAKYMRPPGHQPLDTAMTIGYGALNEIFLHDYDTYSLRSKDRVDPKEKLLFNKVFSELCGVLDVEETPDVYVSDAVTEMTNAQFEHPTFLIPSTMLSGMAERRLRFTIAQHLTLMRPAYYFTSFMQPAQLKLVLGCLIHQVRPEFDIGRVSDLDRIQATLRKTLRPEWEAALSDAVEAMFADEVLANVDVWLELVAAEANYTGLLCCDDTTIASEMLEERSVTPGPRNLDLRRTALLHWSWSEEYLALRRELGISIS